jgi:hypothetical protein
MRFSRPYWFKEDLFGFYYPSQSDAGMQNKSFHDICSSARQEEKDPHAANDR